MRSPEETRADGEDDTRGEPSKNHHREAEVEDLGTLEKAIKGKVNVGVKMYLYNTLLLKAFQYLTI